MTTVRQLVTDAIIDLGQHDPSETIDDDSLQFGLRTLNRLIGLWSTKKLLIPYNVSESFSCDGSTSYTVGSGGTASSTRAKRIISAFARSSDGLDTPIPVRTKGYYNTIVDKSLGGTPEVLCYDPIYPIGIIYFYPVPGSGITIYIESTKELQDSLELGTTLTLPREAEELIVLGLRNRLAPSYGVAVNAIMLKEVNDATDDIGRLNLANNIPVMSMPAGVGGLYRPRSINEG